MPEAEEVRALVRAWDARLRRDRSRFELLAPEAAATGTMLRRPASNTVIETAESRLGVRFPDDYRTFLSISSGAWASSLGPERQIWGRTARHGFLPGQEVAALSQLVAESDDMAYLEDYW